MAAYVPFILLSVIFSAAIYTGGPILKNNISCMMYEPDQMYLLKSKTISLLVNFENREKGLFVI